jgi:hypothetical protein
MTKPGCIAASARGAMSMRATRSKVVEWFRMMKVGIGGEDLEAEICDHVVSPRNVRSK